MMRINLKKYTECCINGHKFDGIPPRKNLYNIKGKLIGMTSFCTNCFLDHPDFYFPFKEWKKSKYFTNIHKGSLI